MKYIALIVIFLMAACTSQNTPKNTSLHDPAPGELVVMKNNALNGDIEAQVNLGMKYRDGSGVSKDINESVKWFEMAAKQGNVAATMSLGTIYGGGQLGIPKDNLKAISYYKPIATMDRNSPFKDIAMFFLAKQYDELGDKENALFWYEKSSEIEGFIGDMARKKVAEIKQIK